MSGDTSIEWATKVWNPVTGCTKVSEGCRHCYAERVAKRFWGERDFSDIRCHEDRLVDPLHWKKPQRVFVNSMSDLFHPEVPEAFQHRLFKVMKECPQHIFMILTKRPDRMFERVPFFPMNNVWLGVSIENQQAANERIPFLLKTPAGKLFISIEPMLGPIDLDNIIPPGHYDRRILSTMGVSVYSGNNGPCALEDHQKLDWVICGGESGPDARPLYPDWVRALRDQCVHNGIPFFFKQWGEYEYILGKDTICPVRVGKKQAGRLLFGREWNEYPEVKQ